MTRAFQHSGEIAQELSKIAPSGFFIGLRIGFAFPLEEMNTFPESWIKTYTSGGYMLQDPVLRWAYMNVGMSRWSDIPAVSDSPIMAEAAEHGLRYGAAVSFVDTDGGGLRSVGNFAHDSREFTDDELDALVWAIEVLHKQSAPPSNLTAAELEALRMVKEGLRVKQIAFDLGVSEGAIKQRLKAAKTKLGASTSAQAASLAAAFGLV